MSSNEEGQRDVTSTEARPDLTEYRVHTRQAGMAVRVAEQHFQRMVWVIGQCWFVWKGTHWEPDPDNVAVSRMALRTVRGSKRDLPKLSSDRAKDLLKDIQMCETSSGIAGTLTLSRSMPGMAITVDQLDADPFLLNVANGTLDLRTLELMPHHPGNFLTKITNGAYVDHAPAPRWDAFLARVLPDPDVRGYLQRVYGYGLLGVVREHVMPILTGVGSNGKTTMVEAANAALGTYATAVKPELLISSNNSSRGGSAPTPDVMALMGVRFASMVETEEGAKLDTSLMKTLTGGDTITARPLYRDIVTFKPSHLPIMATNHLPEVPADDPALWRRLVVVPFDVVIPDDERDGTLGDTLELEADGILSWAVAGWIDYQANGIHPPGAVTARTAEYRKDSDLIGKWIEDCCTLDPFNNYTTSPNVALWESWQTWARNNRQATGRQAGLIAALLKIEGLGDKRVNNIHSVTGITINGVTEPARYEFR